MKTNRKRFACALALLVLFLSGAAAAAPRTLLLDAKMTQILFFLDATLHTVEGSAPLVEGKIQFDLEDGTAGGTVRIDARGATTGIGMRDATMHANVLESERFPEIVFLPERISELRGNSRQRAATVHGRIKIHGSEHPLAISVEADVDQSRIRIKARFVLPYVQWGMKDESTFLLRVGKTIEVHVDTVGTLDLPFFSASQ
jgi:polyisoprenoid-binding protein YceI